MKKNKNDAVKNFSTKQKNSAPVSGSDFPSETATADMPDERELPFKKVLYGYNPDEVQAFISELSQSYESSFKLHESKLSALKEELAFSNRERDRYIAKCKEQKSKNGKNTSSSEDKIREHEATIETLNKKLRILETENERLTAEQTPLSAVSDESHSEKLRLLEDENKELKKALVSAEKEKAELSQQLKNQEALSDGHRSVLQQLEKTKALLSEREKELKEKCDEIEKMSKKITNLISEKKDSEKKISELEIHNSVFSKRIAECEEENSKLRETNKAIIFENAEKINELESELANSKLAVQKELKLYSYYIERAELTVAELTKQIGQISFSINNSEI